MSQENGITIRMRFVNLIAAVYLQIWSLIIPGHTAGIQNGITRKCFSVIELKIKVTALRHHYITLKLDEKKQL